ncbi:MAG: hypothetical protein K0Q72_3025 [Armatimonadetes bacterium]|jgi:hypothetical protein|nr:hypothetical protein [Armatimonadota bacterium]
MLLTNVRCDGCGRGPRFLEWVKGELTSEGYPEWRHPGIVFREAGCPLTYDNRAQCAQFFYTLFERPFPEDAAYLCPDCQERAHAELPSMVAEARAGGVWTLPR